MKLCYLYAVKKLFRMNSAIVTGLLIPLAGNSRWKAFGIRAASGIVEPVGGFALMMVLDVLLG